MGTGLRLGFICDGLMSYLVVSMTLTMQYSKNATLEINTGHMRLISLFMFIYDI